MTEATQGLLANATKGRLSTIKDTLSENDVVNIWENVSSYVEKQMAQHKGVQIPGLGIFAISEKKLEVGNNKFILTQRPVFNVSEKFAQIHGLQFQKYHMPGSIPVLPLNFSSISFESPFDRDTVERCVKEIVGSVSRALAAKRNIELCFSGIGRLTIRDSRVKMKFYKEFINQMDHSGKLMDSLMNRIGTADSVISDRMSSRPYTSNTLILPKIHSGHDSVAQNNHNGHLSPVVEEPALFSNEEVTSDEINYLPEHQSPAYAAEVRFADPMVDTPECDFSTEHAIENIMKGEDQINVNYHPTLEPQFTDQDNGIARDENKQTGGSRSLSRVSLPIAKASGISLTDDLAVPVASRRAGTAASSVRMSVRGDEHHGLKPPTPPRLSPLSRSHSADNFQDRGNVFRIPTPPGSSCGHHSAGQELCYLCHQRARLNVPVSFTEEKKRREEEEERLLQQYQAMKDAEETLKDQEKHLARRYDLQKISAFNLGVAEAVQAKLKSKDPEPPKAFLFTRRPLTPSRVPKQEEYLKELDKQVDSKLKADQKKKADDEFLERLEQVQLAEDLAAQREQYIKNKMTSVDTYKRALDTQLRFKPVQMPDKEPDNEVFGKNDMNNEKLEERRRRAYNIAQEQKALVEQKKRDAILAKLAEQQVEEEVLDRAKNDLKDERAFKHMIHFDSRRRLEHDWQKLAAAKKAKELEDRLHSLNPGILLHEQCDRYNRCRQCKRKLNNCGETNVWSESRYVPGTRIMV
ncbi:coiled-coil domain-containing protein 81-like [Physella acuta]|uniref:coiled-coil domain-containing protein 81-like n=1 Tax=Physella acuta TaxID=109671 RepID=UPI0027DBF91E|nr:coiled-coil domain-containing protein 81-like [Physella acuta]